MSAVFIEPIDVVFFRDDLPFGTRGTQVGRCQFPPRPSVVAGALRTRVLVDRGVHPDGFRRGAAVPDDVRTEIGQVRNGRLEAGTFRLAGLHLGRRVDGQRDETYLVAGRDLVGDRSGRGASLRIVRPAPETWVPGTSSLGRLRPVAVLPGLDPLEGWLDAGAYVRYLAGAPPERPPVREADILSWDFRIGIGLDPATRTVDEGRLFSSKGVAMGPGWGFVAVVEGCARVPVSGLVRLGGDGRMARLAPWPDAGPDWSPVRDAVARSRRFRWVLQTPAIFDGGWIPGAARETADGWRLERGGFAARLVSITTGPPGLAGGWDLVRSAPKAFRRTVPAGSVYWFEIERGSGEEAWDLFHGRSVSDERAEEGFGIVHLGGW